MPTSSVSFVYAYGAADSSAVDLSYAYDGIEVAPSTCPLAYSYATDPDTTRDLPQPGFWAWSTQEIGNEFPHWHMARLNAGGDTQRFINAWGMGMDDLKRAYAKYRKNLFIETAETTEPHTFYYGSVVDYGVDLRPPSKNVLSNSTFTIKRPARFNLPKDWYVGGTGSIRLVSAPTMIGTYSLAAHMDAGEDAIVRQRYVSPIPQDEYLTASIWYTVPIEEGLLEEDETKFGISMYILYYDGTIERYAAPLKRGTGGEWRRSAVTARATKEVFAVTYSLYARAGEEGLAVYYSAAQLERGRAATSFRPGSFGDIPYVVKSPRFEGPVDVFIEMESSESSETVYGSEVTYDSTERRHLVYIDDEEIFWNWLVPSRSVLTELDETPGSTCRTKLGWFSTPSDAPDTFTTRWRIEDNRLQQCNDLNMSEVIGTFDIAEFLLDTSGYVGTNSGDEFPSFSRTLECFCVYQDKLWVVCKEEYLGSTYRVLKILNPHSQWPLPIAEDQGISMFLECLGDVLIPDSDGTASFIGYLDEDPDSFLLVIDGVNYQLDLEYDYYMYDADRRQVLLRSSYEDGRMLSV